jgi:hypothetical protein
MSNTDSLYEEKYWDIDHVCTHCIVVMKLKYVKLYVGPVFLFSKSLLLCTSVGNFVISSPYTGAIAFILVEKMLRHPIAK